MKISEIYVLYFETDNYIITQTMLKKPLRVRDFILSKGI
jgi:hypothetical protein